MDYTSYLNKKYNNTRFCDEIHLIVGCFDIKKA